MNPLNKILVIRNDKLGDFLLSYPTFAILKSNLPDCEIHALVPAYTQDMAKLCPSIDKIILDPGSNASTLEQFSLLKEISSQQFDAVITLFSTTRVGIITFLSRIPYRLAPATKLAQFFYNQRLVQRRSRSEKPEFSYNLDLARQFLLDQGISDIKEPEAPFLQFSSNEISKLRNDFCCKNNISETTKLVFIHAGTGGSANNLSIEQYALLARQLTQMSACHIVLTIGPGEEEIVDDLSGMLRDAQVDHSLYYSQEGLIRFARHIAFADLFIAGSTGPLHIAGALNTPTVGFYTRRRSATPLRWQTLNTPEHRLAFTPPETGDEMDMSKIDVESVAKAIQQHYFND